MKKYFFSLFMICFFITNTYSQAGHFKIRTDDFVQIGYDTYKSLTFGVSTTTPNNGSWALEQWNGGFNFWKPWPTAHTRNYALFLLDNPAFVGIGKHPYHALDVNGDIATYGTVQVYSDERLKRDINRLTPAYCSNILQNINTYSYYLKMDKLPIDYSGVENMSEVKQQTIAAELEAETNHNNQAKTLRHGFLAQELEVVAPDLVKTDGQGYKSIDQMALIPILVESLKAQQKEIELLKVEIQKLKK
jgi:hypothetical protein